jgi:outer membrane lipoprotein LolB
MDARRVTYKSLIILTAILAGCTTLKPTEKPPANKVIPIEKRKEVTSTITAWEISGAMAAKTSQKAWSAQLNWTQRGSHAWQIRLIGPLGGGSVLINRQGELVVFQDGQKKVQSTNAKALLREQTGIELPVDNLYYWVRGLSAPGAIQYQHHDAYNHLDMLKQDGYTIEFTKYTEVNGVDLPSFVRLSGHNLMAKVVIKQWTLK